KPLAAAIFLFVNGLILLLGERLRRRAERHGGIEPHSAEGDLPAVPGPAVGPVAAARTRSLVVARRRDLKSLSYVEGFVIGAFHTLALLAGISRSGITMVGGLLRGLDHEDAAKFAFLLATPVILAAGVLKLPSLAGPSGDGIHGPVLAGAVSAAVAAYLSVRF